MTLEIEVRPVRRWILVVVQAPIVGRIPLPRRVTVSYRYFINGQEIFPW
ncbi:hypothetical protein HXXDennis_09 [Xanthomonas phage HXX_Dennis]|nr:hypothetical protein CPT_Suso_009 [Stenotrophomonas phage Suso]UTQ79951.1 hypothetical protein HXXDennis_09 [Xanthomonas phage HXX_Dennis]